MNNHEHLVSDRIAPPDTDISVAELIREDIIAGVHTPNERLKVSDLAHRHGVSTSPVREALQMLRGEGFVVLEPNRGARVRPVDETFVRNVYEVEMQIEPYLIRGFVQMATAGQIEELDEIRCRIERLDAQDSEGYGILDTQFHSLTYTQHQNLHAIEIWRRHRAILGSIARRFPTSLSRRTAVTQEHRALLDAIRDQDEDRAAAILARHVEGSGRHTIEQMRALQRKRTAAT